jgi:hypothetical protein
MVNATRDCSAMHTVECRERLTSEIIPQYCARCFMTTAEGLQPVEK